MTFNEACAAIVRNRNEKALNYAVNCAAYGLSITDPAEASIQARYILHNMTRWRGDEAKAVRAALKATAGVK